MMTERLMIWNFNALHRAISAKTRLKSARTGHSQHFSEVSAIIRGVTREEIMEKFWSGPSQSIRSGDEGVASLCLKYVTAMYESCAQRYVRSAMRHSHHQQIDF